MVPGRRSRKTKPPGKTNVTPAKRVAAGRPNSYATPTAASLPKNAEVTVTQGENTTKRRRLERRRPSNVATAFDTSEPPLLTQKMSEIYGADNKPGDGLKPRDKERRATPSVVGGPRKGSSPDEGTPASAGAGSELSTRQVVFTCDDDAYPLQNELEEDVNKWLTSSKSNVASITKAFDCVYENEYDFDRAVLKAFEKFYSPILKRHMNEVRRNPNFNDDIFKSLVKDRECILRYFPDTVTHAIVLRSQFQVNHLPWGEYIGPSSRQSRCDHAVLLLVYETGKWKIEACTEEIEFKVASAMDVKDIYDAPSSLSQACSYVLSLVWPSYVHLGVRSESVPITVFSCRSKGHEKLPVHLLGQLNVPEQCGDPFSYSLHQVLHRTSDVASQYVRCIVRGIKIFKDRVAHDLILPLSGRVLSFQENNGVDIKFVATAVTPAHRIVVRYGDVAVGTMALNAINLLEQTKPASKISTISEGSSEQLHVFVKVSNAAMHGWAVKAGSCFAAIQKCKDILTEHTKLLYAEELDTGLLTIMEHLHKGENNYCTLTPNKWGPKLHVLWDGFSKLVTNVLVPMAMQDVIYSDLRTGHDLMGNVMVNINPDDTNANLNDTPDLQLIDFDSIISYSRYTCPQDPRYFVKTSVSLSPLSFVFIQVLVVGISWAFCSKHSNFDARRLSGRIERYLKREGTFKKGTADTTGATESIFHLLRYFSDRFKEGTKAAKPKVDVKAADLDSIGNKVGDLPQDELEVWIAFKAAFPSVK